MYHQQAIQRGSTKTIALSFLDGFVSMLERPRAGPHIVLKVTFWACRPYHLPCFFFFFCCMHVALFPFDNSGNVTGNEGTTKETKERNL